MRTLGPDEKELLSASRRNAERLRLQIGQLLAANQLTSRGPKVERSVIDLHGLVEEAVRSLQTLLQEKEHKITVDMAERLEVEGDRRLLEQVLANLLSNAHRHPPRAARSLYPGGLSVRTSASRSTIPVPAYHPTSSMPSSGASSARLAAGAR